MTHRQVALTEEGLKALRQISAVTGKSQAEDQIERAIRLGGMFPSGSPHASADHDRYLAEPFER
jgi:hypothetical protein